ncbi:MAG: hypothetical protein ACYSR6_05895, partial [Planctomycetota bacterium]
QILTIKRKGDCTPRVTLIRSHIITSSAYYAILSPHGRHGTPANRTGPYRKQPDYVRESVRAMPKENYP